MSFLDIRFRCLVRYMLMEVVEQAAVMLAAQVVVVQVERSN